MSGIRGAAAASRCSARLACSSSRKNGFPSARSTSSERTSCGTSVAAQVVEQGARVGFRQRLEPDRLGVPAATPAGTLLEQLRPRSADEQQRPGDLVERSFEQVEQRLVRPVEVLDEHDRRLRGHELRQERDAARVQGFPRREWVELGVGLLTEHEAEDLVPAEPQAHRVGVSVSSRPSCSRTTSATGRYVVPAP